MATMNDALAAALAGNTVELEKNVGDILRDKLDDQVTARHDELEKEMLGNGEDEASGDEGEPADETDDEDSDEDQGEEEETSDEE